MALDSKKREAMLKQLASPLPQLKQRKRRMLADTEEIDEVSSHPAKKATRKASPPRCKIIKLGKPSSKPSAPAVASPPPHPEANPPRVQPPPPPHPAPQPSPPRQATPAKDYSSAHSVEESEAKEIGRASCR